MNTMTVFAMMEMLRDRQKELKYEIELRRNWRFREWLTMSDWNKIPEDNVYSCKIEMWDRQERRLIKELVDTEIRLQSLQTEVRYNQRRNG